ncbi:MAG: hypothetical protein M3365_12235 [Gemmatimonadota bacterium]|nr:hypothetical protein [Gemmatimonadota bacterium]
MIQQPDIVVEPPNIVVQPSPPGRPTFVYQGSDNTAPSAIYEGFRAQRRELSNQLEELESTRTEISSNLLNMTAADPERKVLEERLSEVDKRISTVDGMLAANSAQLAQAAAVPGAVVEPPREIRHGPPEEVYVVGTIFMVIVLLPLSVALARRIWKRSVTAVTTFPRELADRLGRMENAIEATSLEVERIGEGQRFLTQLFTEKESARAIASGGGAGGGGSHLLERKQGTPERLP